MCVFRFVFGIVLVFFGCQMVEDGLVINLILIVLGFVVSVIVGDFLSCFVEQVLLVVIILCLKLDCSEFVIVFEVVFKGWGYFVVIDLVVKVDKVVEFVYLI